MLKLAAALLAANLAGCAAAKPRVLRCNSTPQWIVTDAKGYDASHIFVCFGANNELLYDIRPPAIKIEAAQEPPLDFTDIEKKMKATIKPPAPSSQLPTLGGTAQ